VNNHIYIYIVSSVLVKKKGKQKYFGVSLRTLLCSSRKI